MGYKKQEILERLQKLDSRDIYSDNMINYRGRTKDTKEPYTEVIAQWLLENNILDDIQVISRSSKYDVEHTGKHENENSNRQEEMIAISMFGKTYDHIGKIKNYQVPLKDTNKDKGAGKIDIVSFNGSSLYILELKKPTSKETLLRCVLEAYTYYRVVDKSKLLDDFGLPKTTDIKKAAFVFKDGLQHKEYQKLNPKVKDLMKKLNVEIFVISKNSQDSDEYIVELP